ncbi:MAG: ABC-type branched-subunit amino acid transport system substrate-binding protein [Myxococcota bacterium]
MAQYLLDEKHGFRKIAVVNRADAYGDGLSDAISKELCLGDSTFDCQDDLLARSYNPETYEAEQSDIIVELQDYGPDVIVLIGFLEDGINFLKLADSVGLDRFVLTDGTRSDELLLAGISDELLCRAIGTNPASPSGETFKSFELRYEKKWKEAPGAFNANAYDAIYVLGYGIAAALGKVSGPLTGAAIAAELTRLSSGAEVAVGNSQWNATIQTLKASAESQIDFVGASGRLNFDPATGEAGGTIEAFAFDVDKGEVVSLGEFFTEEGTYTAPQFEPACPVESPVE